ncbi:MAG: putative beta-lysine N-acetyltransferase [Bacteroidales bacterium]|nr:putative beta-lysine N-acetyltransferase [Bacteroidales bacterium]MDD3431383.1 putative beta-lysine N-acetyltransferase [Bacteroidales bacterium]MDD4362147.1 putative beta-lysine N-acetyltransferase [Bacteroidales bacterium]MDD4430638.1 putative beta-lysine N-acetyltransferase [Bacteroidales bacterium]
MRLKSRLAPGKASSRIYLMDLHPDDFPQIIPYLDREAQKENYTKIFAKVPAPYLPSFINAGYQTEAGVPGFYNNETDAFFMAKYFSDSRRLPEKEAMEAFQQLLLQQAQGFKISPEEGYFLKALGEDDVFQMTKLFKKVFVSYPFPIFDAEFLVKSMREDDTRYFGVFNSGELVAVSSAEYSSSYQHAEMTDFAVSTEHRGRKLALRLLDFMEQELTKAGCQTFYTIARLHSLAMNKTFMNLGYRYSGTLVNNTQISGNIESMNVWYKKPRL